MTIIDSHNAPVFAIGPIQFIGLASPSRGSTDNAVWRLHVPAATPANGTHRVTREEVFVAISGTANVWLGGQSALLSAGSALVVPPHTEFSISNDSDQAFEAVVVLPVGGHAVMGDGPAFTPPWAS